MTLLPEAPLPRIHPEASVDPDATVRGNVTIAAGARIASGARLIAEPGAHLTIGKMTIVLENAVIRATSRQSCEIGNHCLIGPHAHVVGATIENEVFIATGASVFHGAWIEQGAEVRINAIVHLKTRLPAGVNVPIGWIAVGNPAQLFSPDQHEDIWAIQKTLDFPGFVYGIDRTASQPMQAITATMSARLAPST